MNLKKIQKFLITAIIAMGLSVGTISPAIAETGGGTGGGGSTGTQSGFYWASVSSSNIGTAYNQFIQKSGWSQATAEREVNNRVGGLDICKNSEVIWFLMGPSVWAYNFQGYPTWDTNPIYRGSIQYPTSLYGPGPTVSQYQNFIDWDNGVGGQRRFGNGFYPNYGYTIVCSYATHRPDLVRTTSDVVTRTSTTPRTYTEPYSWTTEITRQPIAGGPAGKADPIGVDNLHNQAVVQKTKFGEFWDAASTSNSMSPDELTNGVNNALAQDTTLAHGTGALDDANKAGMAEGGILNIKEQTKYATITVTEVKKTYVTINCTYTTTWNSYKGAYNWETSQCSTSERTDVTRTTSKVAGTQKNTGFWQMLAVHCNQADFNALLNSDPSLQKITTPDSTNSISGSVVTKNYGTQPAKLDFGDSTNPDPAKAKTGNLAFFDKECPLDCTPDSTDPGASTSNGGKTNVGSSGAISDGVNTNAFEFFRNNAAKKITLDTWFPKSVNGVKYAGEAPVTTTITRDPNGTPSIDGSSGGKFTMNSAAASGDALFGGTAKAVPTQKNWDTTAFTSPTATILKGLHNSFNLKATWASDPNKPQVFNFKWEYAPNIDTTVPLTGVGFGAGSAQSVGTQGTATTKIEGKCYAFFGTKVDQSKIADFGANTGTGTTNNLDSQLLNKAVAKLSTNFVRATAE